tara:strand:- start:190 stop:384 length:195 start_codon:yes stop_codon:yes gene_type:complete
MDKLDKYWETIPYLDRKYYTRLVATVVLIFYFILGMKQHRPDLLKILFWPIHTHDLKGVEAWEK